MAQTFREFRQTMDRLDAQLKREALERKTKKEAKRKNKNKKEK